MTPDRPLAIQLSTFFEETAPESVLGYRSEHGYEKDRALYAIGNPFGLHLKFYDYSDTRRIGDAEPDPDKSQHLNWTLKRYLDHAVETPPNLTPDQARRTFTESLRTIFEPDPTLDLSKALLEVGNEVVLRGQNQQLRFTFLEGETIHGHAYFEPLTAPVQIA